MDAREKQILLSTMKLWNAVNDKRLRQRFTQTEVKFIQSISVDELGRLIITRTYSKKCEKVENGEPCSCNGFHFFSTQTDVFITLTQKEQNKLFALAYKV